MCYAVRGDFCQAVAIALQVSDELAYKLANKTSTVKQRRIVWTTIAEAILPKSKELGPQL